MTNNNQKSTETRELQARLAAIESLVQVEIVESDEASTKAMVEKVTSAIESALNDLENGDVTRDRLAALSRKISVESRDTDTPVAPCYAYATLMTLARMGYTITAPENDN